MYEIETDNFYKDVSKDIQYLFDTSNKYACNCWNRGCDHSNLQRVTGSNAERGDRRFELQLIDLKQI